MWRVCMRHPLQTLSATRNCRHWRSLAILLLHYVIELFSFTPLDQCTCMHIVKPVILFVSNFYAIYQHFYTNATVHVFGSCCFNLFYFPQKVLLHWSLYIRFNIISMKFYLWHFYEKLGTFLTQSLFLLESVELGQACPVRH